MILLFFLLMTGASAANHTIAYGIHNQIASLNRNQDVQPPTWAYRGSTRESSVRLRRAANSLAVESAS